MVSWAQKPLPRIPDSPLGQLVYGSHTAIVGICSYPNIVLDLVHSSIYSISDPSRQPCRSDWLAPVDYRAQKHSAPADSGSKGARIRRHVTAETELTRGSRDDTPVSPTVLTCPTKHSRRYDPGTFQYGAKRRNNLHRVQRVQGVVGLGVGVQSCRRQGVAASSSNDIQLSDAPEWIIETFIVQD